MARKKSSLVFKSSSKKKPGKYFFKSNKSTGGKPSKSTGKYIFKAKGKTIKF